MTTPTSAQIRNAIQTTIGAVPNVGVVHAYERYAEQQVQFRALFTWADPSAGNQKRVRGWVIRRVGYREIEFTRDRVKVEQDWIIRGYVGLDDAGKSEIVADTLVDLIIRSLATDRTLGGLIDRQIDDAGVLGAQLVSSGPVSFAGVVSHQVELSLMTRHYAKEQELEALDYSTLPPFATLNVNWDIEPFGNVSTTLPADATADATDRINFPT